MFFGPVTHLPATNYHSSRVFSFVFGHDMIDTCGENIKTRLLNKSARFMHNYNSQGRKDRELRLFVVITDECWLGH